MARTIRDVDLVELIKVCGESGVYKLKHGSLEIEFGHVWPQRREGALDLLEEVEQNSGEPGEVSQEDVELLKEMHASELLIEDPELYEKLQLGEGEP